MWSTSIILLLLSSTPSLTFKIHESCAKDNKFNKITAAANEAANMAENAIARADFTKNPGTMMKDLFGDDSPATYQSVKECYQDATTKTGSQSDNDDENLLIYCGSAHLKLIDRVSGLFRDQDHENIDVRGFRPADNSEDACSSNAQAFGYPTRAGLKPGFILVMCQSAFDKSDMDPATNLPKPVAGWREIGDLKLANFNIQAPKVGIDVLEKYLSIKVLHEMMHVGDCIKFPAQLPESKKKEAYGYHKIMEKDGDNYVLSPTDKQSNADSYAFAAGIWYLPLYYSKSGAWEVTPKADRFTPIPLPAIVSPDTVMSDAPPPGGSPMDTGSDGSSNEEMVDVGRPVRRI